MRRIATLITSIALTLTPIALSPAHAVVPADGTYPCTTGTFTITNGAITGATNCAGEAVISAGVTSIGDAAFEDQPNLTTVTFAPGSQLTSIGVNAFSFAVALTAIAIPAGVQSIGDAAFISAFSLTTVTFAPGSQLTSIGVNAFSSTALTSITIPDSVLTLGNYAFSSTDLTAITIPANVISVGFGAFGEASSLAAVTFAPGSQLTSIGDYAFSSTALTAITIPANVTSIGDSIFASASSLTSVTFAPGSQLTSIPSRMFLLSTALTSITIPANVTTIGAYAFYGASNLASVYFLGNAPTVDTDAFSGVAANAKAFINLEATGFDENGATWNQLVISINAIKAIATVKPTVSGKAKVSKTLTVNKGTWTGYPKPTFTYQWYSCSQAVLIPKSIVPGNCKKIVGANKSNIKLAKAQKGKFVAVRVSGNSAGAPKTAWLTKTTAKIS